MIKLKKLLAGVLGAAMMLASMNVTALAEETPMPTIDTTKTGSLTIHKYEYNGNDGNTGTGESTDGVPTDAKGLNGVTFKITKVAELTEYYGTNAKALPSVEGAKDMITASSYTETKETAKVGEQDGIAKFTNLSLGLYLVQETSVPAQITGKAADFLVSIPMTNSTEDDWLYDVHVFPKNKSTYGAVTLLKQGKIGAADAAALAGATFVLQNKGTDNKWTTVTTNNKGEDVGIKGVLTTGKDGKISVSDLAPGRYRFVETGVPNDTGYIMDGAAVHEFVITNEGKVKINGEEVDTIQTPITVTNYKPDLEKEVKNRANSWGNDSDYSAGDTVPYRIRVDVPANVDKLKDFTLSDTMEHQTYKDDTLKIYSDVNLTSEILSNSYMVTTNQDKTEWSIAFNSVNNGTITSLLRGYAGKSIYIYFETTLGEDAVTTSDGNDNTAKLEYSNEIIPTTNDGNPNEPENPREPKKDEITDQATVYTFQIAVVKVDASNNETKLQGVKFDLYRKLANDASGAGVLNDPVKGLSGKYEKVNKSDLTTDKNGAVSVNGLENGEYYLVETKTNDGYNLLKAPVKVEIAAEYATTTTKTTVTDENGKTTTTTTVTNSKFDKTGTNGVFTTTIKNSKGFTLPTTGGMGSIIFIAGGLALAFAGMLIILASNRKKASK